jgi:enoyl-CoA hydratase
MLEFSIDAGVATITLDRPENGNRINEAMAAELRDLSSELASWNGVRVVILTGTGPVFSSGREIPTNPDEVGRLRVAEAIANLPVPVLAAVNGDASDHGLELALAADLRLAAPDARFWFSSPFAGSFPFDGGTQRLPRLIGPGWARDMLLTGRRLTAVDALRIGLVNRVADSGEGPLDMTRHLADQITQGSPLGANYVKEAVMSGADMTLPHALGLEADLNVILQSTSDRTEGISSFFERRPPEFTGQ